MSAHVRAATKNDLQQLALMGALLARLHHELDPARFMFGGDFVDGYAAWFARELKRPEARIGVCDAGNGELLGYAYGRLTGTDWATLLAEQAALIDVYVHEDARKSGVGEALVRYFCTWASLEGAPRVVLMTATNNRAAQTLFGTLGFRPAMVERMREA